MSIQPNSPEDVTYRLDLPSERKNIVKVEGFMNSISEFTQLPETVYYNALIAITEAVNNAIIHGNKCDPSKIASVNVHCAEHRITVIITDEGEGFDPMTVPDPRNEENLLREGGRGVFLIVSLVNDSNYERMQRGMKLTMRIPRTEKN